MIRMERERERERDSKLDRIEGSWGNFPAICMDGIFPSARESI